MTEYLRAEDWLVKYRWKEWERVCNIINTLEKIEEFATNLGWIKSNLCSLDEYLKKHPIPTNYTGHENEWKNKIITEWEDKMSSLVKKLQ